MASFSHLVAENGTLRGGERNMDLALLVGRPDSGGDGMTVDTQNRYYITSHAGIQVFDTTGRLSGIVRKPSDRVCVSVAFAGPGHGYLSACASDEVWRRKTLATGVIPGR